MNKGNKEQFVEINKKKRKKSIDLITQAVEYLKNMGEELSILNVNKETKRLDPLKKGISISSFQSKKLTHIQDIMKEFSIGKYSKLTINKPINQIDIDDIIKITQENKKLKRENNLLINSKRNINKKNIELKNEIELLRGKCIEVEIKYRLINKKYPVNRDN